MRILALLALTSILCACGGARFSPNVPSSSLGGALSSRSTLLRGNVSAASRPLGGSRVTIYAAGTNGARGGAVALASTTTNSRGLFAIRYGRPSGSALLYLVANGGNAGFGKNRAISLLALAPAIGSRVTINEFSTVAVAYALAQFSDKSGETIGASSTNARGIANAALLASTNLVTGDGMPAAFWPNGGLCTNSYYAPENCEGLQRLNALADVVAECTFSKGPTSRACDQLFALTDPTPRTTLAAVHAIAMDPSHNAGPIYDLARISTFSPKPPTAPSAWTIGLKYVGNGKEFDGPSNMAVDARGNVWITNSYVHNTDPYSTVCGGKELIELTALGKDAFRAPFSGGGVNGAGFGIAIDLGHHTWVGNFGFHGRGCKYKPPGNSVSAFGKNGAALSPAKGYTQKINAPQGMAIDSSGTLWIVNNGDGSVTQYIDSSPKNALNIHGIGVSSPFGVAIDQSGNAWVTGTTSNTVVELSPKGERIKKFSRDIGHPMGIAVDSKDRVWVSNNGRNSVALLGPSGLVKPPFLGGGLSHPVGIAIDGNDNAWVANFDGTSPRISVLCGGSPGTCPRGKKLGDPISPKLGYASSLLMRLSGIAVDSSGNLWVADNEQTTPQPTNPGGDGVVEFIGAAAPVMTPMVGPPQQP